MIVDTQNGLCVYHLAYRYIRFCMHNKRQGSFEEERKGTICLGFERNITVIADNHQRQRGVKRNKQTKELYLQGKVKLLLLVTNQYLI